MRRQFVFLSVCLILGLAGFFMSCREQNTWDPEPGLERNYPPPPPEVSEKFSRVQDPRIAKELDFWIFSANDTVSNRKLEKGLMVRRTSDLVDVKVVGYVLSNVIYNWAKAKLLELDANVDTTKIRMRLPSIKWDGTQWRLYYTVLANTQASVIGYATSPSLENQVWTDKGLVLSSKPGDPIKAAGPSFIALPDNSKHYLVYGANYSGVYITELDKTTGLPLAGIGSRIAFYQNDGNNQRIGFPEIIYNSATGYYYCFLTCDDNSNYGQNIDVIRSTTVTGPYFNYNNENYTATGKRETDIWNSAHILSPYAMYDSARILSPGIGETGSAGVIKDGNNWYLVNNFRLIKTHVDWNKITCTGPWGLQIRNLDWLNEKSGWPVLIPALYAADDDNMPLDQTITQDDIVGTWDYSTRWYERATMFMNPPGNSVINFNADGTTTNINGTWSFDPLSQKISFTSTTWGGEKIYMVVRRTRDNEYNKSGPYPIILAAAGYNNSFGQNPVVWMKQRPKTN